MKSLDEVYNTVVELKYDMWVKFTPKRPSDPDGTVRAVYCLRHADGTSELAGEQMVSAQLLLQVDIPMLRQLFQGPIDQLITSLSR